MTALHVFQLPHTAEPVKSLSTFHDITAFLAQSGIVLERWDVSGVDKNSSSEHLLARFHDDIEDLKAREGYQSADVISLTPDHKDRLELREKFLQEHTHSEDEVRLFVLGSGTFFVPVGNLVVKLICVAGDLLRVPANMPHWFDSGEYPDFTAIRIFTNPQGWVGNLTGRDIFH
jgi:1,2-dihydroxy-3-keto-5-methylthiopentene dioxygenase